MTMDGGGSLPWRAVVVVVVAGCLLAQDALKAFKGSKDEKAVAKQVRASHLISL